MTDAIVPKVNSQGQEVVAIAPPLSSSSPHTHTPNYAIMQMRTCDLDDLDTCIMKQAEKDSPHMQMRAVLITMITANGQEGNKADAFKRCVIIGGLNHGSPMQMRLLMGSRHRC